MKMKKLWLVPIGLAALATVTPALAADMAARPYTKAPPPAVAALYDWSGFYIGANGGWGQARACWDFVDPFGVVTPAGCRDASGGLFGGQIGYRWQTGQFVFGLEGQGDWADLSATRIVPTAPAFSTHTKVDGIGLITGQIGYAWNNALLYVKGGAAVTGNRFDVLAAGVGVASASSTRWGAAVGVGFEYGFAPNWSIGAEYDHLFMGNANNTFSVVNPVVAGAFNRIHEDVDMITLRINYRFGGYGAPLAARY
jgi:outer membrane immunogenic protein